MQVLADVTPVGKVDFVDRRARNTVTGQPDHLLEVLSVQLRRFIEHHLLLKMALGQRPDCLYGVEIARVRYVLECNEVSVDQLHRQMS